MPWAACVFAHRPSKTRGMGVALLGGRWGAGAGAGLPRGVRSAVARAAPDRRGGEIGEQARLRGERRARAGWVGKSRGRAAAEGRAALGGWSPDRSTRRSLGAVAAAAAAAAALGSGRRALGEGPAPAAAALLQRPGCGALGSGRWPGAPRSRVPRAAPEKALRRPSRPGIPSPGHEEGPVRGLRRRWRRREAEEEGAGGGICRRHRRPLSPGEPDSRPEDGAGAGRCSGSRCAPDQVPAGPGWPRGGRERTLAAAVGRGAGTVGDAPIIGDSRY